MNTTDDTAQSARRDSSRAEWARVKEQRRPALGQSTLTEYEQFRLPLGNQNTGYRRKSICKWQCVKAAAEYYDVEDWTSLVDPKLSYRENIELMRQLGTYGDDAGMTMKRAPELNLEARPRSSDD